MDTEKLFLTSALPAETMESLENATNASALSDAEKATVEEYVEATRHFQEIHSLYQVFLYNLKSLIDRYDALTSDELFLDGRPASSDEDCIAVNACVNNILGAAKVLTTSMDTYLNAHYPKSHCVRARYQAFSQDLYDKRFPYRFCIRLRDFTQHGHLAVSREDNRYYFDLHNIRSKPHYKHNGKIKDDLEKLIQVISDNFQDTPRLSLTLTLLRFTDCLMSLYEKFLDLIGDKLSELHTEIEGIISRHPEHLICDGLFFLYDAGDNSRSAHCFTVEGNPLDLLAECKAEAAQEHEPHKSLWESSDADMQKSAKRVSWT